MWSFFLILSVCLSILVIPFCLISCILKNSPSLSSPSLIYSIQYSTMKPYFSLSLLTLLTPAIAQDDPISRAETALHVLQDWYNEGTGLWDTVGWWNGANCMTALADLALAESHSGVLSQYVEDTALDVFNITHSVTPKNNPHPFSPPSPMPTASSTTSGTASGTSGTEAPSPTDSTAYWSHSPDWVDGSFDDDGWWALAWIAAYDLTRQQEYLNTAKDIFESLVSSASSPGVS